MIRIIKREQKQAETTEDTIPQPPMIGTIEVNNMVVTDTIVTEADLSDENILGAWGWDGASENVVTLKPINEAVFLSHLPDVATIDEDGNEIDRQPPTLHEPCRWAGWPKCFGE